MFPQLHISLNLHFIFLVLAMKIYPISCFIVQVSQFLVQDNGPFPHYQTQIVLLEKMYYQVADTQLQVIHTQTMRLHYSLVHMSRFLSRGPNSSRALGLLWTWCIFQKVYFVSPMSDKCTKEWLLQHCGHVVISKTFNRNALRLNYSIFLCTRDFIL
jgi:hypothetical protein